MNQLIYVFIGQEISTNLGEERKLTDDRLFMLCSGYTPQYQQAGRI